MVRSQIVGALEEAAYWGRAGKLTKVCCFLKKKRIEFYSATDATVGTTTFSIQIRLEDA